MNKLLKVLFLIFIFTSFSNAQEKKVLFHLGGYFGLNFNNHIASFSKLDEKYANCCPKFESANGIGIAIGGLFEKKLSDKFVGGLKFGFSQIDGTFTPKEIIGNTELRENVPPYNTLLIQRAEVEHYLSSKLYTLGIEPYISFNLYEHLNSSAGFRFAYLYNSEFTQYEKLIKPNNVTFLGGTRKRNEFNNEKIPSSNKLQIFGIVGISYDLLIGKNSYLSPTLNFNIPFTNISKVDWKANTLQMSLALKFPVYEPRRITLRDTIIERDTLVLVDTQTQTEFLRLKQITKQTKVIENATDKIERTTIKEYYERVLPKTGTLDVKFEVFGINRDGKRTENPTLIIEEVETEEGFPLLPYVFFPSGESSVDKTKMKLLKAEDIRGFNENSLDWNTLQIYYNLLNIIGSRLRNNSNATITLTGTNNNSGIEQNNLNLSLERAESVKKYLVQTWGIKPERIKTQAANLPSKPTSPNIPEGIEENSRVEITSNDMAIIAPVYMKEIDIIANPPTIEVRPIIETSAGVKYYDLTIKQNNSIIRQQQGKEPPDSYVWQITEMPIPKLEQEAVIKLEVIDNTGQKQVYEKQVSIQQKTIRKKREFIENDYKIERYSLILFDFDKSTILDIHKPVLDYIKTKIMPNSRVKIYGYADRTGSSEYNRELARRRCDEVRSYLKLNPENVEQYPIGSDELIYDNNLPEGRSYSRTVKIEIRTPIF